jgi:hypothetical protein
MAPRDETEASALACARRSLSLAKLAPMSSPPRYLGISGWIAFS